MGSISTNRPIARLDKIKFSDVNGKIRQLLCDRLLIFILMDLRFIRTCCTGLIEIQREFHASILSSTKQETIVYGLKKPMDIHVFVPSLIFSGTKVILYLLEIRMNL